LPNPTPLNAVADARETHRDVGKMPPKSPMGDLKSVVFDKYNFINLVLKVPHGGFRGLQLLIK
jgi:hypothetical protein